MMEKSTMKKAVVGLLALVALGACTPDGGEATQEARRDVDLSKYEGRIVDTEGIMYRAPDGYPNLFVRSYEELCLTRVDTSDKYGENEWIWDPICLHEAGVDVRVVVGPKSAVSIEEGAAE